MPSVPVKTECRCDGGGDLTGVCTSW